jgi:hypothetical protein
LEAGQGDVVPPGAWFTDGATIFIPARTVTDVCSIVRHSQPIDFNDVAAMFFYVPSTGSSCQARDPAQATPARG